jgi:dipeptidyl aminopeptidase/acylaminoacyl peptidase
MKSTGFHNSVKNEYQHMKLKYSLLALAAPLLMNAQQVMTPEILWTLKKVGVQAVSPDQASLIYKVGQVDLKTEKTKSENYFLNVLNNQSAKIDFGKKALIQWDKNGIYAQEGDKIYLSKDAGKHGQNSTPLVKLTIS